MQYDPTVLWVILFLPLIASGLIVLFALQSALWAGRLSCAAVTGSFLLSVGVFFGGGDPKVFFGDVTWLSVGSLHVGFGLTVDPLSKLMLLIVTGVGALIHYYSLGYLADDPGKARYFAKLSLFMFSMLGIVLSSNFIQMFIFWELVGVSSYLLIGFWYERASAAEAAKKAFLVNRVGDFGFILGIMMVWMISGTLEFSKLGGIGALPTIVALLIFCGCVGKSAQVPLHVWLPDAMEGPTPVSALIHAATMVAAGVYMLCRVLLNTAFDAEAMLWIAWVGVLTAALSALMGCVQNDIKRILAYSTLSQLGYMVMAVGLSGANEAMFHLTTHAFFKALLFLGAGSIIIALHHEQDIWRMGGLRGKMRLTFVTFLIGCLAMTSAPVPFFSGFWSKDEILSLAAAKNSMLFAIALGTAGLTAFYMWRLCFVVFFGNARSDAAYHAKESPRIMTIPLVILAILATIAGAFAVPQYLGSKESTHDFWSALFHFSREELLIPAVAYGLSLFGFTAAWAYYHRASAETLSRRAPRVWQVLTEKFYFDRVYDWMVANLQQALAKFCDAVDYYVIAVFGVRGLARLVQGTGWILRRAQTGDLTVYVFVFVTGLVVILYFVFIY